MIRGIGIDIIELERIENLLHKNPRFSERVLTERELTYCETLVDKRKIEFIAGRFAAKEAFSKAVGTGIGAEVSFQDIEILNEENGRPILHYAKAGENAVIHISISHSEFYAVAQVVIEER